MSFFSKWIPRAQAQVYQTIDGDAVEEGEKQLPISDSARGRSAENKGSVCGKILCTPWLSLLSLSFVISTFWLHVFVTQKVEYMKHFCTDLPYPPTDTGFKFEVSIMNLGGHNPFGGEPRQEVDDAWDNLLAPRYFRASEEEMVHFGELDHNSVALENGGYVAQFRVFEELQCMDWFRRQFGNLDVRAVKNFTEHDKDHCLNILLKGVRCRADTTLSGWFLRDDDIHKPLINRWQAEHVCVKWDSVLDWLRPRAVGSSEAILAKDGRMSYENMLLNTRAH